MGKSKNDSSKTLQESKTLVNFNIDNAVLEKVRDLAFWESVTLSEIYQTSVVKYLERYEEKYGQIKPRPVGKGLDSV